MSTREVYLARPESGLHLAEVDPFRRGEHGAYEPGFGQEDDRLRDVAGVDAGRFRLSGSALRAVMRYQLEVDLLLVKNVGQHS